MAPIKMPLNQSSSSLTPSIILTLTLLIVSGARAERRTIRLADGSGGPIELIDIDNEGIDSQGRDTLERVLHLEARIQPHHRTTNGRVNFPRSGQLEDRFRQVRAVGDERGHLVASQFSGPPAWYNLSPQDRRVNRNAGGESVSVDWYNEECKVRQWLSENEGRGRYVMWKVTMTYFGNSNRPSNYKLVTEFYENGALKSSNYQNIPNPLPGAENRNWQCRACGLWRWSDLDPESGHPRVRRHLNIRDGEWCTLMMPPVDFTKIAQPKVPNPKEDTRGPIGPVVGGALTGLLLAILNIASP